MKINAELIERSAAFTNCIRDRELDMRGNKITAIENLAITRDRFDTLDLTDNEIRVLGNFPTLGKLSTLLISNNQIGRIDDDMAGRLPNLATLVLTNNRFEALEDLSNLRLFTGLRHLTLMDNSVCKKPEYRAFLINLCPKLKTLDFQRVNEAERAAAQKMEPALSLKAKRHSTSTDSAPTEKKQRTMNKLTEEQRQRIRDATKAAKSLDQINRLERILLSGSCPDDFESIVGQNH
jgi:U2 small nuclear ribonucleoprotein A'